MQAAVPSSSNTLYHQTLQISDKYTLFCLLSAIRDILSTTHAFNRPILHVSRITTTPRPKMATKTFTIAFRNVKITMHPSPLYMAFALVFLIAIQLVADELNLKAYKSEGCRVDHYCNSLGGYPAQDPHNELCSGVSPCCVMTIPSSYRLWIAAKVTEALRLPMFTIAHAIFAYFASTDEHTSFGSYVPMFVIFCINCIVTSMASQWWLGWQLTQGPWPRVWVSMLLGLVGARLMLTSKVTIDKTVLPSISGDNEEDKAHNEASGQDLLERAEMLRKHCERMVEDGRAIKELAGSAMKDADSAIAKAHIVLELEKASKELEQSEEIDQEENLDVASVQLEGASKPSADNEKSNCQQTWAVNATSPASAKKLDEEKGTSCGNHACDGNATCPTPVEKLGVDNEKSCSKHTLPADLTIPTPASADDDQGEAAQESSQSNKEEFCQKLTSSLTAFIKARSDISEGPSAKEKEHNSEVTRREHSSDFVKVEMSEAATEEEE